MRVLGYVFAALASLSSVAHAQAQQPERPNILWIVSEDNSAQWLGCYGNKEAKTPRLDALAKESAVFESAYSNAPVCAVARATLLMGAYSPTMGTQHMRSRHVIPAAYKPYVSYLREQGYYCTNNAKTDYNIKGNDTALWDVSSNRAHYKNRPSGKPFFAVFNIEISHESNLFPEKVQSNRDKGLIPQIPRLDPKTLFLPPYVPDLPEMRSDWAIYHDTISAMDKQVGEKLDELERSGQAENTIVFYYADHGGPTPRGKRYLEQTGVRIPLMVRVPKKWRSLSPFMPGQRVHEPVAFVDFAPTLLSLLGQPKPAQMQGRAFLGSKRVAVQPDAHVFLYADRFDELYGMRRGITDGRYKYIRRFLPHLAAAPYSYYQLTMPGWAAWQKAWQAGTLTGYHKALWEGPQATEELFDLQTDPWELKNLAGAPSQAARLAVLRGRLKQTMLDTRDTGIIPEPMFAELAPQKAIADYPLNRTKVLDTAFLATERNVKNLPTLQKALASPDALVRYWGALGCVVLGKAALPAKASLEPLLTDSSVTNRITAAHALVVLGQRERGVAALASELEKTNNEYAAQLIANTLTHQSALEAISPAWIEKTLANPKADEYLKRLAARLQKAPPAISAITAPPAALKAPAFYKKYISANGYPIVASEKVNDYALKEAAYLVNLLLAKRPDVRDAMIASGSRMCILAYNEFTTDQPDFAWLMPKDFWDRRARGLGGSETDPLCSCAEENLLGYPGDPYAAENILIHEFAHNIHLRGMVRVDKTFDSRVKACYESAMKAGLWKGKYASTNHHEYFAEGVQSWFDNNRENDHDHNHVNTRAELIEYDPGLAALCREVFGDTVLKYTKPATRLTGHMEGYNPKDAPTFVWPERLRNIKQAP
ncbi:sulfatase-like hydrolase/transferase [Armatimonas rosea]|uniref:Arylsulfatase A-like enzyme n=1 Tax=Armatimonas rosea TaxID=685828 RepID=A0A7W9SNU0_ARMRO|nr:sulfatase-like hydrolase/transferase [Armatimonas rosea]MBB6049750.1 arylsulfatase A-like enzyme [Armatimonas rosea]